MELRGPLGRLPNSYRAANGTSPPLPSVTNSSTPRARTPPLDLSPLYSAEGLGVGWFRVRDRPPAIEHLFAYGAGMGQRTSYEELERMRRSVAMLSVGQPALKREEALRLLAETQAAHSGATTA